MLPGIDHDEKEPYILDYIKGTKIPALTRKNARFFKAVVKLDSSYRNDFDPKMECSPGFNPLSDEPQTNKYYGSTAYWFAEMEKENSNFERCLMGAIISIDSTNTTHLESCVDGRKTMKERILNECKNVDELKAKLNKQFFTNKDNHLIAVLSPAIEAKPNKDGTARTDRHNLSFASKFCAYASKFLETDFEYPKYDGVVAKNLPKYIEYYVGNSVKKTEYKVSNSKDKQLTEEKKLEYRLDIYYHYFEVINKIINSLPTDDKMTKEEFDHIVWYAFK